MGMPTGLGVIDLMLQIPREPEALLDDALRKLRRDADPLRDQPRFDNITTILVRIAVAVHSTPLSLHGAPQ